MSRSFCVNHPNHTSSKPQLWSQRYGWNTAIKYRKLTNAQGVQLKILDSQVYFYFFVVVFLALPCGMQDLSSPNQGSNLCPVVEAQSFTHWTAREVPRWYFFKSRRIGNPEACLYSQCTQTFIPCLPSQGSSLPHPMNTVLRLWNSHFEDSLPLQACSVLM